MAYTNRYLLEKIIDVQNLTLEHKRRGVTQTWIYENLVKRQYGISKSTYDKWLCRNAKKELSELVNKNERKEK